jgi:AraC-like DNA-binding protein
MAADALSDILRAVRLTGATFFNVVARSPWVAEQPTREMVLPKILPGANHLIAYHIVTKGRCFTNILGEQPIEVGEGKVIVYTRGDPHVVSSGPGMRADPVALDALNGASGMQLPFLMNYGGDGPVTDMFVCGFLVCDAQPFNPLIESLPPIIVANSGNDGELRWLGELIRLAMTESSDKRPGGESVLARLSELMFIEVVRQYLEGLPPAQVGWLAGLRDPFVGKALSLMHGDPSRNWGLEELARAVGLSRSVFAERFTALLDLPPMQYLAKWRMQVAAGMLSGGNSNIATVAAEVGYSSEASFSRAFKNIVGVPPSVWRRGEVSAEQELLEA